MRAAKQNGFSWIELMVVVLLAGLLVAAATPMVNAYSSQRGSLHLQARLLESLAKAQEAALSGGEPVSLCASRDGKRCEATGWEYGWLVYKGAQRENITSAQIIEQVQAETVEAKISVVNEQAQQLPAIRFNAQGFSADRVLAAFCQQQPEDSRVLLIERTGRFRAMLKLEDMASASGEFRRGLPRVSQMCVQG